MKSLKSFIEEGVKRPRLSPEQKKALEKYHFANDQQDRYLGSVFVNHLGKRDHEEKVKAAHENCKRLGIGPEHGIL